MNQDERIDYLLKELSEDSVEYKGIKVAKEDRRDVIRSLMNIRMPKPISNELIQVQNDFLREEIREYGVVSLGDIPTLKEVYSINNEFADKISIWQGDITRLQVDAIVNAANSQLLGCFIPCHKCIDNAIHSAAGIQLRDECYHIMRQQGYEEPTARAKITLAYNLPCKHVIHTVGPIVSTSLEDSHRRDLASCYRECLKIAIENNIRSIAFCCISTGEFRFPNENAAIIAVDTVKEFLTQKSSYFDRIIFNTFKNVDNEIYHNIVREHMFKHP